MKKAPTPPADPDARCAEAAAELAYRPRHDRTIAVVGSGAATETTAGCCAVAAIGQRKTPEQVAPPHTSFIEEFFEPTLLKTVFEGKTFDPDKESDAPGKYGKTVFATRVVEPNADKINFTGFVPLLDRWSLCSIIIQR